MPFHLGREKSAASSSLRLKVKRSLRKVHSRRLGLIHGVISLRARLRVYGDGNRLRKKKLRTYLLSKSGGMRYNESYTDTTSISSYWSIGPKQRREREEQIRRKQWLLQKESIVYLQGRAQSLPPLTHPIGIHDERWKRRNSYPNLAKSISEARCSTYTLSQRNVDDICPDNTLCETCRGLDAEVLISESGYQHLLNSELTASAKSCSLCYMLWSYFNKWDIRMDPCKPSRTAEWWNNLRVVLRDHRARLVDENGHEEDSQKICYFTNELDPAVELGVPWKRRLTNTRSERSFDVARSWLTDCCEERDMHARKTPIEKPSYDPPSRLIDLAGNQFILKEVCATEFKPEAYCTLSYCWGDHLNPYWITKKSNLQDRKTGFNPSELPKTLRDATAIAQQLGIRYIWIDSVCIVQDDRDDWALEGSKMAGIYRGSRLSIAACSSDSSTKGIFNDHSTSQLEDFFNLVRIDNQLRNGRHSTLYLSTYVGTGGPMGRYVRHGVLPGRAWCLQELILSPRILYYTPSQLLWECAHLNTYEDRLELREDHEVVEYRNVFRGYGEWPIQNKDAARLWYEGVVTQYTYGKLTYGSDKLVAVSALAVTFNLKYKWEYLSGLWREALVYGLQWARSGRGQKASEYRCPSWSWASQDSAVFYVRGIDDPSILDARIISATVDADYLNPYGSINGGEIKLQASLVPATVTRRGSEKWVLTIQDKELNWVVMDDDDFLTKQVECVYLNSGGAGLLLVERGEQENTYKRVGIAVYLDSGARDGLGRGISFESTPRSLITII
ncbi:heterokaryon incompatibility protein-domain-containing protein [Xylaria telfairii]|nr:heterokaryon incompatibility protein-domain-containing protein [Xylaria telfairii]